MGGKGKDKPKVEAQPAAEGPDIGALINPMMMMMQQQTTITQQMLEQQKLFRTTAAVPDTSTIDALDYDKENQALKAKLDKQITDADIKRKGVLGTILTNIDDEDDPNTTTSLLGRSPK